MKCIEFFFVDSTLAFVIIVMTVHVFGWMLSTRSARISFYVCQIYITWSFECNSTFLQYALF